MDKYYFHYQKEEPVYVSIDYTFSIDGGQGKIDMQQVGILEGEPRHGGDHVFSVITMKGRIIVNGSGRLAIWDERTNERLKTFRSPGYRHILKWDERTFLAANNHGVPYIRKYKLLQSSPYCQKIGDLKMECYGPTPNHILKLNSNLLLCCSSRGHLFVYSFYDGEKNFKELKWVGKIALNIRPTKSLKFNDCFFVCKYDCDEISMVNFEKNCTERTVKIRNERTKSTSRNPCRNKRICNFIERSSEEEILIICVKLEIHFICVSKEYDYPLCTVRTDGWLTDSIVLHRFGFPYFFVGDESNNLHIYDLSTPNISPIKIQPKRILKKRLDVSWGSWGSRLESMDVIRNNSRQEVSSLKMVFASHYFKVLKIFEISNLKTIEKYENESIIYASEEDQMERAKFLNDFLFVKGRLYRKYYSEIVFRGGSSSTSIFVYRSFLC